MPSSPQQNATAFKLYQQSILQNRLDELRTEQNDLVKRQASLSDADYYSQSDNLKGRVEEVKNIAQLLSLRLL